MFSLSAPSDIHGRLAITSGNPEMFPIPPPIHLTHTSIVAIDRFHICIRPLSHFSGLSVIADLQLYRSEQPISLDC